MKTSSPIVIAIDGHAATGKSTQAKKLANHYQWIYIDTGAMYRAVAWVALQRGWIQGDELNTSSLINHLKDIRLEFKHSSPNTTTLFLNGQELQDEIRTMEVSQWVSRIAKIPEIRSFLVAQQQALGAQQNVIMDGRDIGTVVFPEATVKFFFSARPEIRAQRRLEELQPQQPELTFEEVLANVKQRDHLDSTREHSPLKPSKDAYLVDVSNHSIAEIFAQLCNHIDKALN